MAPTAPVRYLTADEVRAINDLVLQAQGTRSLLFDAGALGSALMRAPNAAHYRQADVIEQAAVLVTALALAHAFLDGNKRTAAISGDTFLRLNGYFLVGAGDEFGRLIEALVIEHGRGDAAPAPLLAWLRAHAAPLPHPTE